MLDVAQEEILINLHLFSLSHISSVFGFFNIVCSAEFIVCKLISAFTKSLNKVYTIDMIYTIKTLAEQGKSTRTRRATIFWGLQYVQTKQKLASTMRFQVFSSARNPGQPY